MSSHDGKGPQESPAAPPQEVAVPPTDHQASTNCAAYMKKEFWFSVVKKKLTKAQKKEIRTMQAKARERMGEVLDDIEKTFLDWAALPEQEGLECMFNEKIGDNTSS